MDEVDGLRKLGHAVFEGSDPTVAAQQVLKHPSATPLAIVIANVALNVSDASRAKTVIGAVLGAHANTAIMSGGTIDAGLAAFAAVIGAANAESMAMMKNLSEPTRPASAAVNDIAHSDVGNRRRAPRAWSDPCSVNTPAASPVCPLLNTTGPGLAP
jgi:hypothetical protein